MLTQQRLLGLAAFDAVVCCCPRPVTTLSLFVCALCPVPCALDPVPCTCHCMTSRHAVADVDAKLSVDMVKLHDDNGWS
jgi:hypothetical protein